MSAVLRPNVPQQSDKNHTLLKCFTFEVGYNISIYSGVCSKNNQAFLLISFIKNCENGRQHYLYLYKNNHVSLCVLVIFHLNSILKIEARH